MSILVAFVVALAMLVAGFTVRLGDIASARARAQLAADAAALAAVAESGPYGNGDHRAVASRVAAANGGRLIGCDCEAGATEVEVDVALGRVTARARARLDIHALMPLWIGVDDRGLHPRLAAAVRELVAAARGAVYVVSGYRSTAHQRLLWADAVRRYGRPEAADDWVARPGHSLHERGLAVDLGGDIELAARLVAELGLPLHRPLDNEPWHFEFLGVRR